MELYQVIFPDADEPIARVVLPRQILGIPKGSYLFLECYCTQPGCDCRRVTLLVMNDKKREKALISFGFDQQGAFAGPYLDASHPQVRYAPALLTFFVELLNSGSEFLERLYKHYVQVRERVDGRKYDGTPFPQPGTLQYRETPPPDLMAEIEQSLKNLDPSSLGSPVPKQRRRGKIAACAENGMAFFVKRYAEAGNGIGFADLVALRSDLRLYVLECDSAGDQLASLIPELCRQCPQADEQLQGALRLLLDTLKVMDVDMETDGAEARLRMERFQEALAQRVFIENEDLDLCAAVWTVLVQSRAEILPVMREATTWMAVAAASRTDLEELPGEELMSGLLRSLRSMGITSAFQGAQELLRLFTLNEPEMQTAVIGEMLQAQEPLLRDIAALMLFNREEEVRFGVSHLLAEVDGALVTPETLRRLIVCRNWFPVEIRRYLDLAIGRARRARVECAPLGKPDSLTVYASAADATGALTFHAVVPEGNGYASCEIVLKQGTGVTDASVVPIKSKLKVKAVEKRLSEDSRLEMSSAEHLDRCVCNALAEGAARGEVPPVDLLRVAELLGRERWMAVPSGCT